jgi:hypothetical protein
MICQGVFFDIIFNTSIAVEALTSASGRCLNYLKLDKIIFCPPRRTGQVEFIRFLAENDGVGV